MIDKPVWFDYLVWDFSDPSFPKSIGFEKDTPKEIIEQYEKDKVQYKKEMEENPDACIFRPHR